MSATNLYKDFIKQFALEVKHCVTSYKDANFYVLDAGNIGLFNFQKSRTSTKQLVTFTANIGICSKVLLSFFSPALLDSKIHIEDCHLRKRIGNILNVHQDKWWELYSENQIPSLIAEFKGYFVDLVVPYIKRSISDQQLCHLWLTGDSPGLTDFQRLMYLSVLLKNIGNESQLVEAIKAIEQVIVKDPYNVTAKMHLKKLNL